MNEQTTQTYQPSPAIVGQIKANRSLLKFFLLNIVTLGIYSIFYYSNISTDINVIASRYDGKKTMHFCLMFFVVSPLTLGIGGIVWMHNISARIGNELNRRGINDNFGASTFWLWAILGSLIIVGPFVYIYKLSNAINMLAENYNING